MLRGDLLLAGADGLAEFAGNTIGSYLILGGIGPIYAKIGALDFSALEKGVASAPGDAVIDASFALLAAASMRSVSAAWGEVSGRRAWQWPPAACFSRACHSGSWTREPN